MNRETLMQVQGYLDNELTPAEARKVAEVISANPEARSLYDELKDTKRILMSTGEAPLQLPEGREFYWSQIQRRIESDEREPRNVSRTSWWMRLMAPVAGAVALLAVLLSLSDQSRPTPGNLATANTPARQAPFHEIETQADYSTITFRSESQGMTVVWVNTQ